MCSPGVHQPRTGVCSGWTDRAIPGGAAAVLGEIDIRNRVGDVRRELPEPALATPQTVTRPSQLAAGSARGPHPPARGCRRSSSEGGEMAVLPGSIVPPRGWLALPAIA